MTSTSINSQVKTAQPCNIEEAVMKPAQQAPLTQAMPHRSQWSWHRVLGITVFLLVFGGIGRLGSARAARWRTRALFLAHRSLSENTPSTAQHQGRQTKTNVVTIWEGKETLEHADTMQGGTARRLSSRRRGGGRGRPDGREPQPAPAPAPTPPVDPVAVVSQQVRQLVNRGNRGQRADARGGIVRLAFHDAAGKNGPNGCVDMNAGSNGGLQAVINMLAPVVAMVAGELSQADVWMLAANVAIESAGGPQLEFAVGRIDVDSCEGEDNEHPDAELGAAHLEEVFVTDLLLTKKDVVALLGAHVLGRAQQQNSGYDGPWVRGDNSVFTNQFFVQLLNRRWTKEARQEFQGQARTQWSSGPSMMLNTDIELAFDTSSQGCVAGGPVRRTSCPRATHDFEPFVNEFATNQTSWHAAFAEAWGKLFACPTCNVP